MSFSTPISQLQNNNNTSESGRQAPIENVSYSDILQRMDSSRDAGAAPMQQPPPPPLHAPSHGSTTVQMPSQYAPSEMYATPKPPPSEGMPEPALDSYTESMQTDAVLMFLIICMVHLPYTQDMIVSKIPSMLNPSTSRVSIVGIVFNASISVALWIILRKAAGKYIKM